MERYASGIAKRRAIDYACEDIAQKGGVVILRSWTLGDWFMALAVLFFVLAGAAKIAERQGRLGLALILLGLANAILLTLSRK